MLYAERFFTDALTWHDLVIKTISCTLQGGKANMETPWKGVSLVAVFYFLSCIVVRCVHYKIPDGSKAGGVFHFWERHERKAENAL